MTGSRRSKEPGGVPGDDWDSHGESRRSDDQAVARGGVTNEGGDDEREPG